MSESSCVAEVNQQRARRFWQDLDVNDVFDQLLNILQHLREAITTNTASDTDYVKAMKIILESEVTVLKNEAIEEVLIDEDILTVTVSESQCSPDGLRNTPVTEDLLQNNSSRHSSSDYSQISSASRNEALCSHDPMALMSPMSVCSEDPSSPVPPDYQPHDCGPACGPPSPAHAERFLGHNPFRVPMMCHFQRHCVQMRPPTEQEMESECQGLEVIYTAPCGRSLHCMEEVLRFLLQSDSLGLLQLNNFSFSPQIVPERQTMRRAPAQPSVLFERDLSRGIELVPVSLSNEVDGIRPKEFRYRKERWPHGCFLSAAPFFSVCCDCTDGCADVQNCACLQRSVTAGTDEQKHHSYKHMRLHAPVNARLFECGPWCSCERSRCQNRLVQRGLRVRLQVFRTLDRGWAVRCQDDLDKGTFVCIYAGVVLRRQQNAEPVAVKNREPPMMSDDEVEVVDEWTHPTEATEPPERSPPLYVPVIQRPADQTGHARRTQHRQVISSPDGSKAENDDVLRKKARLTESKGHTDGDMASSSDDDVYYLSASTEGNVARFINHSCEPNLFIQNVFVDTHDPKFPLVAFFTNRMIKAGTELTWNYSYRTGSYPDHEVSCHCGNSTCQELII